MNPIPSKVSHIRYAATLILWAVGLLGVAAAARAADTGATVDLGQGVKLELVPVPKGSFRQGSPATEPGRKEDEKPRAVALTEDFLLGKYPVTVGQFRRFVEETRFQTEAERGQSGGFGFDGKALVQRKDFTWRKPGFPQTDEHPVTMVTFQDAQAFCGWLSNKAHRKVGLPTEAQWEYACRAGTTTAFYSGDAEEGLQEIGWFQANSPNGTQPVGQKQPNAFGLYDMSGHVYEWCRDVFGPYDAGPVKDPVGTRPEPGGPPRNSLRGGSFLKEARHCRSAARYRNTPASRNADNGFRVVATVAVVAESPDRGAVHAPPPVTGTAAQSAAPATSATPEPAVKPPVAPPVPPSPSSSPARPPSPVPATRSHGFSFGLPCCAAVPCLVVAGIVVFILMKVLKQFAPRSGGSVPLTTDGSQKPAAAAFLFPEPAEDGFWLPLSSVTPGSIIHYRCLVHGVWQDQTVVAESSGRQFVYTGGAPQQITIVDVQGPGAEVTSPLTTPPLAEPIEQDRWSPPSSRGGSFGHPPAY